MADEAIGELQREVHQFIVAFEQRHSVLEQRVTRLEAGLPLLATKEDLARMKDQLVDEIRATLSEYIATRTDVDWLKRGFWIAVGALTGVIGTLAAVVVGHIAAGR